MIMVMMPSTAPLFKHDESRHGGRTSTRKSPKKSKVISGLVCYRRQDLSFVFSFGFTRIIVILIVIVCCES